MNELTFELNFFVSWQDDIETTLNSLEMISLVLDNLNLT